MRASVYELSSVLEEPFDVVLFLGVLYHLRHPLLALDEVRALTRKLMLLETAVSDHQLGERSADSIARFYRRDELGGDPSNWFAPTARGLVDWCCSLRLRHGADRRLAKRGTGARSRQVHAHRWRAGVAGAVIRAAAAGERHGVA